MPKSCSTPLTLLFLCDFQNEFGFKELFVGIYLVLFARNMIFHQFRTSAVDLANVAKKASLILLRFHLQRKQKNDNYMHKLITFFV